MSGLGRVGFHAAALVLSLAAAAAPSPTGIGETTMQDKLTGYLERALARGVPLYNDGRPAACAAVYATALEAIVGGRGWGVGDEQRARLRHQLTLTAALEDPDARAWAYRRLIDALLAGEPLATPATGSVRVLYDFSNPGALERWRVVLDSVMGGRSTGQVSQEDGALVFTGMTSLRNDGGFSSVRALVPAGALVGFDALRVRVRGDGRTWILGANADPGRRGSSFWHRFETSPEEWRTVTVPLADLVRQSFGRPVSGTLRPADVRAVEFYIYDGQAGPFRLEVARVEALRTRS